MFDFQTSRVDPLARVDQKYRISLIMNILFKVNILDISNICFSYTIIQFFIQLPFNFLAQLQKHR